MRTYALAASGPAAQDHYALLAALWDEVTFARLRTARKLAGARCLELGAGAGYVALWLARQVGEDGHVLATDRDVAVCVQHSRLEVRQHDLSGDEPLPGGWDLIHARLTLMHVPEREELLPTLVDLLAPGGVLCIEDLVPGDRVLSGGTPGDRELYGRFRRAVTEAMANRGSDADWGLRAYAAMRDAGLSRVSVDASATAWTGGSTGARLQLSMLRQLRPALEEKGLTSSELDRVSALLEDPDWAVLGHSLVCTTGFRHPPLGAAQGFPLRSRRVSNGLRVPL